MIDSNNIEIIRDNLKELDQRIDSLDVEIPTHTSSDAGKYLGVDSSGDLEFSDPLPATDEASAGDVLGLVGENKAKGWLTPYKPPAYSETEYDTGKIWIDGRKIYGRVLSGTVSADSAVSFQVNYKQLISLDGVTDSSTAYDYNLIKLLNVNGNVQRTSISVGANGTYAGINFYLLVEYLKDDPPVTRDDDTEPSPETLTKKKKSK